MTDDAKLTPSKRLERDSGIRQGLERAYQERLMGQLRRAYYDAKPENEKQTFTVAFDRVKDEARATAALEVFQAEIDRLQFDCSWQREAKGTYTVTVTKR